MELSVVVPTLNGRDRLAGTLDALANSIPEAEVVVVNGPSADGTTGMVREREDVDVLVEISDRSVTAARNAGFDHASGSVVALVDHGLAVDESWAEAVRTGLAEADVVTGPTHRPRRAGAETETLETRTVAGREVTYFNSGNVAFDRATLDALDGYDEYLEVGGSRDLAHRLADSEFRVEWTQSMAVERTYGTDGGEPQRDWEWKYRSLAYRLAKNYGTHPTVFRRLAGHAASDAVGALRDVVHRTTGPSEWLATGRDVLSGAVVGLKDGLSARARDRSRARNPHGASEQAQRAVSVYDWR
ncbi:glycosyltransferase family 2 protein [Halapricum desulfuricans]|uniref:Glycosyl transferase family 2 n=1 Tax=Halapricum desulfuricans TaxID=2841257 RepID=A0A897N602_9EURY|nr:glycosyltransferase [Halapricum desulfuricans]QSG08137.1 Glycosyl transferase family 2 [Halapricum desulfuricans]